MLEEKQCAITATAIKEAYLGIHKIQSSGHTVIDLLKYHAKIASGNLEPGTLKNYVTTEEYISRFIKVRFNKEDVLLRELDFEFITELEYYIRNNPIKKHDPCLGNGVMKHLERFKKMVKWGRQLKWLSTNPFEDYKLALKRYKRKKLDIDELERIENKHFDNPKLSYVKDLFLFSCYTGLAYADAMALKPDHLEYDNDGKSMLKIYREKSDELSSVPVLNVAIQLIEKYKDHPKKLSDGTVFPSISNQDLNRNLKIIAEVCGITKYMSFHLARHTFATVVTLKNGVPIETVSKMLGHTKISTTEIYAEVDDEKIMEDMSEVESRMKKRKEGRKLAEVK